jgi:hypothetical protein
MSFVINNYAHPILIEWPTCHMWLTYQSSYMKSFC